MTDSDLKCPHCGEHKWWLGMRVVDAKLENVTNISYCDACGWKFKQTFPLHAVGRNNKLLVPKAKKVTEYQKFFGEQVKLGNTAKAIGKLWKAKVLRKDVSE